jgi:repressor LexA
MSSQNTNDIQKRIYEFIVEYMRDEGMPPTNREIGSAMNIASTGHVDYHLSMLEKKGYITRESKKSRGIELVENPFGIRVIGSITAGEPLEVFTDASEAIDVGRDVEQQGTYALVVKGQSMIEDHICDKDYVVIKPQNTCENGDIVVAVHLQGNGRATLKRFFQEKDRDRVRLQPANSEMDPIYIPKSEWDNEWQVQGKVVAIFRKLRSRVDDVSLILDALLPVTKISPKTDKQVIDSDELKEAQAHENLKKLVMEKVSDKNNNDQVLAKYNEDPEKWREELREELIESKVDQDKQIIKEAHLVLNYQIQQMETAYERIVNSANTTRGQLDKISELGINQAHRWY